MEIFRHLDIYATKTFSTIGKFINASNHSTIQLVTPFNSGTETQSTEAPASTKVKKHICLYYAPMKFFHPRHDETKRLLHVDLSACQRLVTSVPILELAIDVLDTKTRKRESLDLFAIFKLSQYRKQNSFGSC